MCPSSWASYGRARRLIVGFNPHGRFSIPIKPPSKHRHQNQKTDTFPWTHQQEGVLNHAENRFGSLDNTTDDVLLFGPLIPGSNTRHEAGKVKVRGSDVHVFHPKIGFPREAALPTFTVIYTSRKTYPLVRCNKNSQARKISARSGNKISQNFTKILTRRNRAEVSPSSQFSQ